MPKPEGKKDFFVKITTIQLMLMLALYMTCFLYCRFSADDGSRLLADYRQLTAQDMDFNDFRALFSGGTEEPEERSDTDEEQTTEPPQEAAAEEEATTAVSASLLEEDNTSPLYPLDSSHTASAAFLSQQIQTAPVFPVAGSVSSSFGNRVSPIYNYNEQHKGVDIAAKEGTVIRAVMDGIVSMVDYTPGRGNFLIIDHKDTEEEKIQTLYQHCLKILVEPYTVVRAGEAIALVGSTGDSTGPHLHLEYRVNGECVDPMEALFGDLNAV